MHAPPLGLHQGPSQETGDPLAFQGGREHAQAPLPPSPEFRSYGQSRSETIGEIVIRGNTVMKGYLKDGEATAGAFKDGWFFSGDVGRVDEEGFLYLVDRKKDMICSGGVNIYPMDIEEVLHSHPKVHESAVIGIPDDKWGEKVAAVVIPMAGVDMTERAVIDWCRSGPSRARVDDVRIAWEDYTGEFSDFSVTY